MLGPGLVVALLALSSVASAATYYVRADGGDARRCDGRTDQAADRADGRACAWSHPFIALPPGGPARIEAGDRLLIRPGAYRIGIGAPGSESCSPDWPWDCHPAPVPSGQGPDRPTVISGRNDAGQCLSRPELWGAERAARVLDLDGSSHVRIECLEITDRSSCIENHCHGGGCEGEVLRCERDHPPFGDWAGTGVFARDSSDVVLRDVEVHGMALRGFHVGRVRDWTLEGVRIVGNGWSGWDGDLAGDGGSSNSGDIRFRDVEIAWNGCSEHYPDRSMTGCWAQTTGGYGDGLGTARTGGHWQFENVHVHHNTSDGLDLLYLDASGRVTIKGLTARNNAGNQLKTSGHAVVADSTIDGRCDYFRDHPNMLPGDQCRALGNAVALGLRPGTSVELARNRIRGSGDCLVVVEGGDDSSAVTLTGNQLDGAALWSDARRRTCGFYAHKSDARVSFDGNALNGVRGGQCPEGSRCSATPD